MTQSYELLAPLLDSSPHKRKGLSQMACGEYQHVHGVEGVRPLPFGVETHASFPRLADRQIARLVVFQTQSRLKKAQSSPARASFHLHFHVLSTRCSLCCGTPKPLLRKPLRNLIIAR
jgi:hypothetical protein